MPILSAQDVIDDVIGTMTIDELQDPTPVVEPPAEKDPTEQNIRDIVNMLWHPERWNGYLGIARTVGVSPRVVKLTDIARLKKIQELQP